MCVREGLRGIACTVTTEARTRRPVVNCIVAMCRSQHNLSKTKEFMYVEVCWYVLVMSSFYSEPLADWYGTSGSMRGKG